jgi:hypothetical protein
MGLPISLLAGRWPLWVACAAFAALSLFAGRQTLRLADARTALATEQRDRAADRTRMEAAAREQVERFRADEQGWRDAQHENERLARKARDLAAQGAAAADAAGAGLRQRAAVVAAACRRPAGNPAAVGIGPAASAPGDLLVDVLGRLEGAGRQLARYADAARISSEQCAADYQALKRKAAPRPETAP